MKKISSLKIALLAGLCLPLFSQAQVTPLTAYCYPNITSAAIGATITWTSVVYGGNGVYSYTWSGDESLYGYSSSIAKTYAYAGTKYATLNVYSAGLVTTVNCGSTNITNYQNYQNYQNYPYNQQNSSVLTFPTNTTNYTNNQVLGYYNTNGQLSSVYLSNVPYTGIGDSSSTMFLMVIEIFSLIVALFIAQSKYAK